jgi:hypothetical protein
MPNMPGAEDSTEITIPESAPSVEIILPEESRQLSLDTLEKPVRLVFTTAVSWLDGIQRTVSSAEILVNRIPVQQIDVEELERFTADINYFSYGPNDIQVRIEDDLGQTATSPIMTLLVTEGEKAVPEEMRPSGITESPIFRTSLLCLALLLTLAITALVITILRRTGLLGRIRRTGKEVSAASSDEEVEPGSAGDAGMEAGVYPEYDPTTGELLTSDKQVSESTSPYIEILSTVTRMPQALWLSAVEHRIGRSPVQADIVLENDITVSRLHASIVLEGTDYRIYDEGSSSGTWVNGQQVPDFGQQLHDGDEIRLGDVWIRYRR